MLVASWALCSRQAFYPYSQRVLSVFFSEGYVSVELQYAHTCIPFSTSFRGQYHLYKLLAEIHSGVLSRLKHSSHVP